MCLLLRKYQSGEHLSSSVLDLVDAKKVSSSVDVA